MKTSEALMEIGHGVAVIGHNAWKGVDGMVRRWPWLVMGLVTMTSVAVSAVNIMEARAERDSACKKAAHLQEQVESLTCAVEAGKEARR